MSVYRIMPSNKPQQNQVHKRLCYLLIRDILIKPSLTLLFMSQKSLNQFLLKLFYPRKVIWLLDVFINIHPWICTFNDHYLNSLLDNISDEGNKTIALLGDLLNFDTLEHVSTFMDDLVPNSLQPRFFYLSEYLIIIKL